ncbi:hypothetical protein Hanom_Chr16g01446551 [Helianthus anomalus]
MCEGNRKDSDLEKQVSSRTSLWHHRQSMFLEHCDLDTMSPHSWICFSFTFFFGVTAPYVCITRKKMMMRRMGIRCVFRFRIAIFGFAQFRGLFIYGIRRVKYNLV